MTLGKSTFRIETDVTAYPIPEPGQYLRETLGGA
jgi:hypothetical protein